MKILIYYPYFTETVGGGEFLPLTMARYWQDKHDVTIFTRENLDFDRVAKQYGVVLDPIRVKVQNQIPKRFWLRVLDRVFNCYRALTLHHLAAMSDLCISCWDVVDFGRPGFHFMCISDFDPAYKFWLTGRAIPQSPIWRRLPRRMLNFIRDLFIVRVRSARQIMLDSRERVFPNSRYVANAVAAYYGRKNLNVFYPPTIFEPMVDNAMERDGVVCIGRITQDKRIEFIIEIVERVRERMRLDLVLNLAGYILNDTYCARIIEMARHRSWVKLLGPVVGLEKKRLLASSKYAFHARTDENFGISVTEYLKAGVVPLVPNEGGAREVVANDDLTYSSMEDAVEKFCRIISDGYLFDQLQRYCRDRGAFFSAENYSKRQNELLDKLTAAVSA